MKKRISMILAITILVGTLFGCITKSENLSNTEPEITRIRSICQLATLECYYHNVAQGTKEAKSGLFGLGQKDRKFWIEYTGVATVGVDVSKIQMSISGDNIEITVPSAKILNIDIDDDSWDESDLICSEDGIFNKNKITAEDQTKIIAQAQETMQKTVENDSTILQNAQDRAVKLIENYITQLGKYCGKEYNITWKYEDNSQSDKTTEFTISETK
jgi:hypothetical protein